MLKHDVKTCRMEETLHNKKGHATVPSREGTVPQGVAQTIAEAAM